MLQRYKNEKVSALNGLQSIKLNITTNYNVLAALRAVDRLFRKTQMVMEKYPDRKLPSVIYDMYGTLPLTAVALKRWVEEPAENTAELEKRMHTCISILRQELRANAMFELLNIQVKPV